VKLCPRCNEREARRRDKGHYCLPCHSAWMREWRKTHPMSEEQRRKDTARSYAHQYLKRGKIQRQPCRICGAAKAEMHHDDYSKPLEIDWLCRPCHVALHNAEYAELKASVHQPRRAPDARQ
jgi:hypothetical protein